MTSLLKKSAFVSLELVLGVGFGILGAIYVSPFFDGFVYATYAPIISCATGEIEGQIFFQKLTFIVFMFIGIAIAGYFHFKTFERLKEFQSAIGWSFMGFLLFVFVSVIIYIVAGTFFSVYDITFNILMTLAVILPIFGAVIGFNNPIEE